MTAALIWLVIGIALIAAEVLSGDLMLLMLGIGALAGAGASVFTDSVIIDVIVFAGVSIGLVVLARPALKRRYLETGGTKTNVEALIGSQAVALSAVDAHGGQVKLAGGVWSARNFVDGAVIPEGSTVTVVEISGATAIVSEEP